MPTFRKERKGRRRKRKGNKMGDSTRKKGEIKRKGGVKLSSLEHNVSGLFCALHFIKPTVSKS